MSDHSSSKPEPIDPTEILSGDEMGPSGDNDNVDASQFVGGVGSGRGRAGQFGRSSALEAGFSNESVPEHIENVKRQLGVINRYIQSRAVERIQRTHVIKLAEALFDYQYQDMKHLLTLTMDAQKGRRFVQYLDATDEIRTKLQQQSAQAQLSVVTTMFDERFTAFREQRDRDARATSAYRRGEMNEPQYSRAIQDSQALTDKHEESLNRTAEEMITRHCELLYETLALFKTGLLRNGQI